MTLKIRCLDARSEQDVIRGVWRELVPGCGTAYLRHSVDWFFGHLDWISPPCRRLRFVLIQDGPDPLALIPLESRAGTFGGIRFRYAGLIDSPYAEPDTALLLATNEARVGDAYAQLVFDNEPSWRFFSMNGLAVGSASESCLGRAFERQGIGVARSPDVVPYVLFQSGWTSYMATRSRNFRTSVSRATRRLEALGELEYESVHGDGVGALAVVEALDRASWRMAKPRDVEKNATLIKYCQRLFEVFPDPAHHVVRCLRLDGKPVASCYAFVYGGVTHAIKINYDMAYAEGSPGFYLLVRLFEELAAMGIEQIELMGQNQYLHRLGNASREMTKALVFKRSGFGRLLGTTVRAAATVRRQSRSVTRASGRD